MPTYSYGCQKCGTEFEIFRPMESTEEVECPICGFTDTERVYNTFHFQGGCGLPGASSG
ncbi:MAG: zinc ribbon domain-containing protein [Dehalococcoidales bacterium]|jgi:putative FmdB family regulatory protein|nr:zinc ribbon domain-containing protein [Dehalococcoidales bacterium]